jgi:ubiquinone/menaquinone biosynthesis C-methylase UbiE
MMKSDLEKWLGGEGARFLERIGLKPGDRVLDFGCGSGHYTIPAARVVGAEGRVYALDQEAAALGKLREEARERGMSNIEADHTAGGWKIDSPDRSFDAVLAYDVLHYLEERELLFREFHRVLKREGFLSVYPKHRRDDLPLSHLAGISLEEIVAEIERSGFTWQGSFHERLIHDEGYNPGIILKFTVHWSGNNGKTA